MQKFGLAASVLFLLFVPVQSARALDSPPDGVIEQQLQRHGHYRNRYGVEVHRPSLSVKENQQPAGAHARCRDGDWSFSQHRAGTCSGHGGVASWL